MWNDSQRLKAARALGGFGTAGALGAKINKPKVLGGRALRAIEEGRRDLKDYEAAWVAEACGIDPAFFTVDFANLTSRGVGGHRAPLGEGEVDRLGLGPESEQQDDEDPPGEDTG